MLMTRIKNVIINYLTLWKALFQKNVDCVKVSLFMDKIFIVDTTNVSTIIRSLIVGFGFLVAFHNILYIITQIFIKLYTFEVYSFFSWVVFLPLLSSVACGLGGRYLGTYGSMFFSTGSLFLTCIISYISFYYVGLLGNFIDIYLCDWINLDVLKISWELKFDSLTVVMLVVVNTVSFLVHFYSCGYMWEDPHVPRFMSYLSLFTFFMNILVTSNNFVQLFFGWEGVGICSYLLISFWFTRVQAVKSAFKAVIMNKIGDISFLLAMMIIFDVFKSLKFPTVFALTPYISNQENNFIFFCINWNPIEILCFFLMIGAVAKSAQFGLHTWLADAMEGPTPVSALIHAATMVTAGIFLIIRCSPIFEYAPKVLMLMTVLGSITAFVGASIAVVQYDVKKIIAFSTMSQLGYMFFAAGLSGYNLSLFHLFNHAFFKALLFLSAGSLIHSMSDEQDIRKMGGLRTILPITYTCFVIGTISLIGFPFTSGFFSKEAILNQAFSSYTPVGIFAYVLGVATSALTTYYSVRLLWWVFLSKYNGFKSVIVVAEESGGYLLAPMVILSVCTIFSGFLFKDLFIGKGTVFFQNSIFINKINYLDSDFIPLFVKLLPIFLGFGSIILGLHSSILNSRFTNLQQSKFYNIYQFLFNRYHIDTLYNLIALRFLDTCFILYKFVDQGLIEICGPNLIRFLYGKMLYYWKKNLTNSNTVLYLQCISIIVSLNLIAYLIGYFYFQKI